MTFFFIFFMICDFILFLLAKIGFDNERKISFYRLYINEALARFVIMASSIGEHSSSRCVLLRLSCNAHRHSLTHTFQSNQLNVFLLRLKIFFILHFFSNLKKFRLIFFAHFHLLYVSLALCIFASRTNDTDLKIRNTPIHTFNFHFYFLCTFF